MWNKNAFELNSQCVDRSVNRFVNDVMFKYKDKTLADAISLNYNFAVAREPGTL